MMGRTPPIYKPAKARGVLPVEPDDGSQGVSFELPDGTVVRFRLDADSVMFLLGSLASYRSEAAARQADTSVATAKVSMLHYLDLDQPGDWSYLEATTSIEVTSICSTVKQTHEYNLTAVLVDGEPKLDFCLTSVVERA